ncbi:MAG: phosphohydrolase, partial [Paludibacteraceae bacterium]|nr:phosphohydrolase [Paludibacteraceae bacterium]
VAQQDPTLFGSESLRYFLKQGATQLTPEALHHFTQLDDSDIWVALKSWCHHPDKVLSLLSNGIVNRQIFKVEISNTPFDDNYLKDKAIQLSKALNLSLNDVDFLTSYKKVTNNLYREDDNAIDILFSDGTTKRISEASDMFNLDVLSKPIHKYYYCHFRV